MLDDMIGLGNSVFYGLYCRATIGAFYVICSVVLG